MKQLRSICLALMVLVLPAYWSGTATADGGRILVYCTCDGIGCTHPTHGYPASQFDEGLPQLLTPEGFTVDVEDRGTMPEITFPILATYDQFWFLSTDSRALVTLSTSEKNAVTQFVDSGGGVAVMADHPTAYTATANQLSTTFGVTFTNLLDRTPGSDPWAVVVPDLNHPELFFGVVTVFVNMSECDLAVSSPAAEVASFQSYPLFAINEDNPGRVFFDPSFVRYLDGWIDQGDNAQRIINLADWLQPCNCGDQSLLTRNDVGDINCDGATDPLDVQFLVNFVFKGLDARGAKPSCPFECGDENCDGGVDPLDVQFLVNFVFKSLDGLCNPCD